MRKKRAAPLMLAYDPAVTGLQTVRPVSPAKDPLPQKIQLVFPRVSWYLPFSQAVQAVTEVAVAKEYEPVGQLEQVAAEKAEEKVPLLQLLHEVCL